MDRWTCLRCFAANDDSAMECANCGLLRGATPPAGTEAPPPPNARSGAARGLLRWIIPLAIFGAVAFGGYFFAAQRGDNGEITQAGTIPIADLRIGDCFDLPDADAEATNDVDAKPCSETHQFELMHLAYLPVGEYPPESEFQDLVVAECLPAYEAYIGIAYDQSRYDIFWFYPTQESWDLGDRSIQCAVYDPLTSELVGSLQNANR